MRVPAAAFSRSHTLPDGRPLVVREAQPGDAARIVAYMEAVSGESDFLTFGPGEFGITEAMEVEHIAQVSAKNNHTFLLAFVGDELVGALVFTGGKRQRIAHRGEFGMSVKKALWGQGVGGRLLDALIDWAREGGIVKKLNLLVRPDNTRGLALYQSRGFVQEGLLGKEICVDGICHDLIWMGLWLG